VSICSWFVEAQEGALVPKEFINPNLHVILIHYPLGLLTLGTLIELFAIFWRRSGFRVAGRWMILLGALSLVPTATLGLYAMADVNKTADTELTATWEEVRAQSPVQGEAWEMMVEHGWYNAAGSGVILLLVVSWLAASDVFRRRMHLAYLVLLLGGLSALVLGAWHGGEMVYRHGVGVEVVREAADHPAAAGGSGEESAATEEQTETKRGVEYYAPPLQVHVTLAGLAVSLGLAAIGLSFRAGAVAARPAPELSEINYALNPNLRPPDPHTSAAQLQAMDNSTVHVDVERPPVARFWVLGALVGLAAAAAGWWVLAYELKTWQPAALWEEVQRLTKEDQYRRIMHVIVGVGLVVLMLLLSVMARMAAARRFLLALFVLVFLGVVGAQVWLGSLLMFDTPSGSVWKFNSSGAPATQSTPPQEPSTTSPSTAPSTTRPSTSPVASIAKQEHE
jgi:uncharacterized membrane protein